MCVCVCVCVAPVTSITATFLSFLSVDAPRRARRDESERERDGSRSNCERILDKRDTGAGLLDRCSLMPCRAVLRRMNPKESSNGRRSILLVERRTEGSTKCTKRLGTFAAYGRLSSFVRDCNTRRVLRKFESNIARKTEKERERERERERYLWNSSNSLKRKYTGIFFHFFFFFVSGYLREDFPAKLTVSFIGETEKLDYARV